MAQQQVHSSGKTGTTEDSLDEVPTESVKTDGIDEAVDSILDEIDTVLEPNAEMFVNQFIQKGGE